MVDPDILILLGHVVDPDKGVRTRDEATPAEASLLTWWHWHAAHGGKDNIAIGFLLRFAYHIWMLLLMG